MSVLKLRGRGRVAALGFVLFATWAAAPVSADPPQLTDAADDAYRYPDTPAGQPDPKLPMSMLSNDTADILSVTYAPAAPPRSDHNGAYSASLTLSGEPHATFNYIVGGQFGADCFLIHFLGATEARHASVTCGGKFVGSIEGSVATVKGNTLSGTFSFRRSGLPSALRADPEIHSLYATACPAEEGTYGCTADNYLDWAESANTFRI